jgi:hypothetical protein
MREKTPGWMRLLFLLLVGPFGLLAACLLGLGAWMAFEAGWYAAMVFLGLGSLLAAYHVGLSCWVAQGRL